MGGISNKKNENLTNAISKYVYVGSLIQIGQWERDHSKIEGMVFGERKGFWGERDEFRKNPYKKPWAEKSTPLSALDTKNK